MMPEHELNSLGVQQRRMLEIIWQRNGATVQEVLDAMNASNAASDSPQLAYTTVLATMQKLEKSGWLTHSRGGEHGATSATTSRAYIYRAKKSRREAIGDSLRSFAETFLDGSKTLLFQHFISDTGLSDEELDEIRMMVGKRRS
jgi:predicted transcriptional regulator